MQKVGWSAPRKKSEVLFFSATVRDHRLTEIRWMEDGQRWSAFSNIDFNLLTAAGNFESDDTVYSLLLTVQNEDTAPNGVPQGHVSGGQRPPTKQRQFPRLDIFSLTESQYLIVGDQPDAEPQAKMLAALDALHIYYDANRRRITDEYARREAGRIEQERMLRAHPPKPKDTVVNYWIGTKPVVPAGTTTGGRP